jgi:transposase
LSEFSNKLARSDKKLVGWAGLAPTVHQSGERTVYGGVGRGGNRLVRWVLVEAAQAAVRSDERFRIFYEGYASRKGVGRLLWLWLMKCSA